MSYNVFVTTFFKKEAEPLIKKYHSLKNEIHVLIEELQKVPCKGVSLGKDCYKIRLAIKSKGKGKSGGARIITLVKFANEEVFLLSIFDKANKDSISDNELKKLIEQVDI